MTEEDSKDYGQRLARVETHSQNIYKLLTEIKAEMTTWKNNYVPRNELNAMFEAKDKELNRVNGEVKEKASKKDIDEIKQLFKEQKNDRRANKTTWPAWTAAGISFLLFLLQLVINITGGGATP